MIYGPGMLESGITFDLAQLVLDCEFARMIKHTVKGFPVSEDSLATDIVQEVGPFGDFLSHAHTYTHMREQSNAKLIDRRMRSDWELDGSTDSYARARKHVLHILENHQPDPLPDEVLQKIRQIVTDTEKDLGIIE